MFSVPRGSVLEPILFCWYTKLVSNIIQRFGSLYHSYADTQFYNASEKNYSFVINISDIEILYVRDKKIWMERNMSKLNDKKTQVIVFKSYHNVNLFARANVDICGLTQKYEILE